MSFESDVGVFAAGVNAEMPKRVIVVRGAAATGDPNLSNEASVNNLIIGSQYLQDDVVPKILWTRTDSSNTGWTTPPTMSQTLALILALG